MPIMGGKKQLEAASLEELGNNDFGDKVTLGATSEVLKKIAADLLLKYETNVKRSGRVDTGISHTNAYATDIEIEGSTRYLDIMIPEYAIYQDRGVNGTEVNHGSPYSYKNKMPPLAPLLAWARRRAGRALKYKPTSKLERKDQRVKKMVSESNNYRSLAFAIGKSIQKKGIKPSKDFTRAVESTEKRFAKDIANGFKIDIINSLKDGD